MPSRAKRPGLLLALVLLLVASSVVLPSPPAQAWTFDWNKAVEYADKWTVDTFETSGPGIFNPEYRYYGNDGGGGDCTNFASQVWYAAGIPMDFGANNPWWYYNGDSMYFLTWSGTASVSWVEDTNFVNRMVAAGIGTLWALNLSNSLTNALPGNIFQYDWGRGDGFSHLSVHISWGPHTYPPIAGSYHWGDYMTQHSTDRKHAPWNWGWLVEDNPSIKANMQARLLAI